VVDPREAVLTFAVAVAPRAVDELRSKLGKEI
jgi:hypothetical protein